ncbi:hypothetical protein P171DRAFT_434167 [Karstenula rhodostoma CBS 690.94]|uniref:Uncharacterized protein n=1 Tax=Karstenula rhodostoma CBS 690.94 TaxID=1392251 RepID=A0A9P4U9W1_9PLEO|nr:hypothetical protein P171DRAFT_434167 [Karstenula rhodostoma CBS 690.94]
MGCCFGSDSKDKSRLDTAQQACIIKMMSNIGGQRAAIASFDYGTYEDVVSKDIVELLGMEPLPIEKEARSAYPTKKDVFGEAILNWSLEKHPRRVYSGIFYISSDKNPSYDVVLGMESAKKLEPLIRVARKSSVRSVSRFPLPPPSFHEPPRDFQVSPKRSQRSAFHRSTREPAARVYQAQQPSNSHP